MSDMVGVGATSTVPSGWRNRSGRSWVRARTGTNIPVWGGAIDRGIYRGDR